MDFWKLSAKKRAILAGILSLVLTFSGVSVQGFAEALGDAAAADASEQVDKTEAGRDASSATAEASAGQTEGTAEGTAEQKDAQPKDAQATQDDQSTKTQDSQAQAPKDSSATDTAAAGEDAPKESSSSAVDTSETEPKEKASAPKTQEAQPTTWTISLVANGGSLVAGTNGAAATIKAVENGDAVTIPSIYERTGYVFKGWSTVADHDGWWEARKAVLANDPSSPEPADTPLFVPANAKLTNLSFSYVVLEDGTVSQVSEATAAAGRDDQGREVKRCDLLGRVRDGRLELFAQWDEADKGDAQADAAKREDQSAKEGQGQDAEQTPARGEADENGQAEGETGDAQDTDDVDPAAEPSQAAKPVADSPTGAAAILTDPEAVIDSAAGDPEATAVLDQVEKSIAVRELLSETKTSTSALGLSTLGILSNEAQSDSAAVAGALQTQDSSESVTLAWVTEDDEPDGDESNLRLRPGYDEGFNFLGDDTPVSMQARLQLSLDSNTTYDAGAIQITVPAQFMRNRSYERIGSLSIDVPEEPDASQYFAYRLVTTTDGSTNYVITNTRTIEGSESPSFLLTYSNITPHEMRSGDSQGGLQATLNVVASDGNVTGTATSGALTAQINTSEELSAAYHNGGTVVAYADAPETVKTALNTVSGSADSSASNYVLVRWNAYATVKGNQAFTLTMKDDLTGTYNNTEYPAIKDAGGNTVSSTGSVVLGTSSAAASDSSQSYEKTVLDNGYIATGETCYETVWTAYPASLFDDGATYTITNLVTWTLTSTDTASTSSLFRAASITYTKPTTAAFPENLSNDYAISKETLDPHKYSTSDNEALNDLSVGKDVTVGFTVSASGEIMRQTNPSSDTEMPPKDIAYAINNGTATVEDYFHKQYVTVEASDDVLYLGSDYTSELGSGDYYVSQVSVNDPLVYTYDHTDGDAAQAWTFQRNTTGQLPNMALYGLSETSGGTAETWTKLATVEYDENNSRTVTAAATNVTADGATITLDESLKITRVKLIASTKIYDKIELSYNPYITLRHDSTRVQSLLTTLFANSTTPTATIRNDATLAAYAGDAVGAPEASSINPTAATAEDTSKLIALIYNYTRSSEMKRTDALDTIRYGGSMEHGSSLAYLRGVTPQVGVTSAKTCSYNASKDLDASAMQATVHYTATVHEQSNVTSRDQYAAYVKSGVIVPETSGTWYDLLPPGVEPVLSSITLRDADALVDAYTVKNYKGSGRTLLVVKAKLVPVAKYSSSSDYWAEGYYDEPKIEFDAVYSYADYAASDDTLVNVIAFESGNDALGTVDGLIGEPDDATLTDRTAYNNSQTKDAVEGVESYMTNLNAEHDKPVFVYARDETALTIDRFVSSSTKTVASDAEGIYRTGVGEDASQVNVYAGQDYTYRINVGSSSEASNIVIYDALESYVPGEGDSDNGLGVEGQTWKGTLVSVDTSELTDADATDVQVYYNTSSSITSSNISSYTKLANNGWTTEQPDDLSTVTAVAIDCGSDFKLTAGSSVPVYIHMTAPSSDSNYQTVDESGSADDPDNNSHAFNSAYISMGGTETSTSTDYTKVGILPYKVTVSKVWDDGDDQDGVRPESVTVNLLANGEAAKYEDGTAVPAVELGPAEADAEGYSDNGWTYTYTNLPSMDGSGAIRYTVTEDAVVDSDGNTLYTPSYLCLDDTHLQVTNKRLSDTVEVCGTKTWVDDDDDAGKRPSTILVRLYANGVYQDSQRIGADSNGNWSYSFTDLPANSGGEKISYTVVEDTVDYYAAEYDTTTDGTTQYTNITNTYSATGYLAIDKTVEDAKSTASKNAKFTFTVELFDPTLKDDNDNPQPLYGSYSYYLEDADGNKVDGSDSTVSNGGTITLGVGQKAIVTGIPANSTYRVTEQSTAGFSLTSSENTSGTVTAAVDVSDAVVASFTNTYSSAGSFQLQATKELTGQKLAAGTFQFEAYLVDGESEELISTASNRAGGDLTDNKSTGDVVFSRINVTNDELGSDGTLTRTYKIREVIPDGATKNDDGTYTYESYTYGSQTEQTVTFTFEDAGDGTITIMRSAVPTFTNTYTYTPTGELNLVANKSLIGSTLSANQFTFTLEALTGGAPTASTMTATNDADGVVAFPAIALSKDHAGKSYIYKATENAGSDTSVNYSNEAIYFLVSVTDDGAGNMTNTSTVVAPTSAATSEAIAAGTVSAFEATGLSPTITNTYKGTSSATHLYAKKTLDGAVPTSGAYSFTLTSNDSAPMPTGASDGKLTVQNGESGIVDFGEITYTAAGTYTYTIAEFVPTETVGITYDTATWTATVTVTGSDSTLAVESVTYVKSGDTASSSIPLFKNTTSAGTGILTVSKIGKNITSSNADDKFTLAVTLTNSDQSASFEKVVVTGATSTTSDNGTYTITLKAGDTVTFSGVPANTTYTVSETTQPAGWTQTGSVNAEGTVKAGQTTAASITNTYSATGSISLQATKTMELGGLREGDFTFELFDGETSLQIVGNLAPSSGTKTGKILFDQIEYDLDHVGEHTYTMREVVPDDAVNSSGVTWSEAADDMKTAGGFTYDGIVYGSGADPQLTQTVTVTVADAGNGKLTVTPSNIDTDGTVTTNFTNAVKSGLLQVATTALGTNEAVKDVEFRYCIIASDAAGNPVTGSYPIAFYDANGKQIVKSYPDGPDVGKKIENVSFGNGMTEGITNIKSGEYFVIGGLPAGTAYSVYEMDSNVGFKRVAVTNDQGTIEAGKTAEVSFTTAYEVHGVAQLKTRVTLTTKAENATKTIKNHSFTFQLYDEDNNLLQTKKSEDVADADYDEVTFDEVGFEAADAGTVDDPKVHKFRIVQVNDSQKNIDYDMTTSWVSVSVSDSVHSGSENPVLTIAVDYDASTDGVQSDPHTFENTYTPMFALPYVGGSGLAAPIAVAVIALTAEAARRMRRWRREE